jgi:hypothetical protein
MRSPIEGFFKLGEKATGGDPIKKALFDYLLMGIVFCALLAFFVMNLYSFITTLNWRSLFSSLIFLAFMWFNYWALIAFRMQYNMMKSKPKIQEPLKIESVEEMIGGFKNEQENKN